MIPKVIHQVWLRDANPKELVAQWRFLHPAWGYRLWTPESITALRTPNKVRMHCVAPQGREEILRWELLYTFGGVVATCPPIAIPDACLTHQTFIAWDAPANSCVVAGAIPKSRFIQGIIERISRAALTPRSRFGADFLENYVKEASLADVTIYPPEWLEESPKPVPSANSH